MPMKVRYTTANGRIISQNSSKTGYQRLLNDPLGNVIATADSTGAKSNDTTYWPYGEVRTGGVGVITSFGFCGTWGYYTDSSGRQYVRARYYRPTLGRWHSVDPLWPDENAFQYVSAEPVAETDPSGLWPTKGPKCTCIPKPFIERPPTSQSRHRCMLKACSEYCKWQFDWEDDARQLCGSDPFECQARNQYLKVCNATNYPHWIWEWCGKQFCNGIGANQSHWPNSCDQPLVGDYCCVECGMRACCMMLQYNSALHKHFTKEWKRCEKIP